MMDGWTQGLMDERLPCGKSSINHLPDRPLPAPTGPGLWGGSKFSMSKAVIWPRPLGLNQRREGYVLLLS